jgi:hypothetical protein
MSAPAVQFPLLVNNPSRLFPEMSTPLQLLTWEQQPANGLK